MRPSPTAMLMNILKAISNVCFRCTPLFAIILPCCVFPSDNSLFLILKSIALKNRESILYVDQRHLSYEFEKSRLQKGISLSIDGVPYFQKTSMKVPFSGKIVMNNYLLSATSDPFSNDSFQNTIGFFIPAISSKKKIVACLDRIIDLEKRKSRLEIENILVEDLKLILLKFVELCRMDDEVRIRIEINRQINATNKYLGQFIKSGFLGERDLTGLKFLHEDNLFQMNILKNDSLNIVHYLNGAFALNSLIWNDKKRVVYMVDSLLSTNRSRTSFLKSRIDSLNRAILLMQIKSQSSSKYNFYLGPTLKLDQDFTPHALGIGAQFWVDIPGRFDAPGLKKIESPPTAIDSGALFKPQFDASLQNGDSGAKQADEFIKKILKEISMENFTSIYFLSEIFNKMTLQRINSVNSEYVRISYSLQSLRSLGELGMDVSPIEP
jgi:hypothetical protein